MPSVCRALLLFVCCLIAVSHAYSRMELEDRMQMSRFHEPGKGAVAGPMGDDSYLRYLSEYFGRPMQRRAAPIAFAPIAARPSALLDTM